MQTSSEYETVIEIVISDGVKNRGRPDFASQVVLTSC